MIVLYDLHHVFAVDALASSHPLSCAEEEVNDPAQISEMFSSISYRKVDVGMGQRFFLGTRSVATGCSSKKLLQVYFDDFRERRCSGCCQISSPSQCSPEESA